MPQKKVGDHSGMAQAQRCMPSIVLGIFTQLSPAETSEHFVFQFRSGISVSWAGGILHQGTGTAAAPWEASNKKVWHVLAY